MKTAVLIIIIIKTHGCVSVAKKAVWCTGVLFTGTANLLFSTPCISITAGVISIKFTYYMLSMCTTLHTLLKEIGSVVCKIYVPDNFLIFFTFLNQVHLVS